MAQFASDTFTGSDSTELNAYSSSWTKNTSSSDASSSLVINGNRVAQSTAAKRSVYYHSGTPSSADYTVSGDVYVASTSLTVGAGVVGRMNTGAATHYLARLSNTVGGGTAANWQLFELVTGTYTKLGSDVGQTVAVGGSYNCKLSMEGTAIKLFANGSGTPSISVTNSSISAAGKSGISIYRGSGAVANGEHLDNFSADEATSTQTLTPGLFTNSNTFYSATVSAGSVDLAPSLISNTSTFYAPTVSQGGATQDLTPGLFSNSSTFYAPTVTPGAVDLTPSLYSNSGAFYAPTVNASYDLTPVRLDNSSSFYAATVTPGTVTLSPGLFSNSSTFYSPIVSQDGVQTLQPARLDNSSSFYAPTITTDYALSPSLVSNSSTIYAPTITAVNELTPARLDNTSVFYGPIVVPGAVSLIASLFSNSSTFYSPTVSGGEVTVIAGSRSIPITQDSSRRNLNASVRRNIQTSRR